MEAESQRRVRDSAEGRMVLSRAMDQPRPYISLRAAQTSVNISTKLDFSEDAKRIARYLSQLAKEENDTNGPHVTR